MGNVYAHKTEVIGDYKIDVGWKSEPPIAGLTNAIEIIITVANEFEKQFSVHDDSVEHEGMTHEEHEEEMEQETHEEEMEHLEPGTGIIGLANKLEAIVRLDGEKTELVLIEQSKAGLYHAVYTPSGVGFPSVNLAGEIGHTEFEITFHPEKVEELNALRPLQQIKANIAPSDVQCKENLQLVLGPNDRVACVKPKTAETLVERGWTLNM